jgi:hypothetical protein
MAQASTVSFKFGQLVGLTGHNFDRVFISSTQDGKLMIRSVDGEETVEPKIIADQRGGDGNLQLDLGKGRTLTVTSGFSPDGKVDHFLKEGGKKIILNAVVYMNVN